MRRIILFETAEELVTAFGDFIIPNEVSLDAGDDHLELRGEGSENFQLADTISLDDVIYVMAVKLDVRLKME